MTGIIALATAVVSGVIALISYLLSDKRRLRQLETEIKEWEYKKDAALANDNYGALDIAVNKLIELRLEQTRLSAGRR